MAKISVIIPIYNAECFLKKAIESILIQSFDDFELILIDDGSVDNSSQIIDWYESQNKKIIAIHQSNSGVSKARNVGIEKASGQWIYFLDSDDWIEPDYLSNFIKDAENYDLIIQGFATDYTDTGEIKNVKFKANHKLKNYEVIEMLQYKKNAHNGYLWHRLFKRSIIIENNLRFVEGCNFAEDGVFFLQYMRYVKKTNVLETSGHHYVIHNSSLTNRKYPSEFYLSIADMFYKALNEIEGDTRFKNFTQNYTWQLVFYWIINRLLYAENKQIKIDSDSVLGFLRSRDVKKPFLPISSLKFISSIASFTAKRKLLSLFIFIEKKRINISKYFKQVINE